MSSKSYLLHSIMGPVDHIKMFSSHLSYTPVYHSGTHLNYLPSALSYEVYVESFTFQTG